MSQHAAVFLESSTVQFELPTADEEVLPGVKWGSVDAFPSPAYWAYQVLARRVCGKEVRYRLGNTLAEEISACLLGGHGIPSSVGVAAFQKLRSKGLLVGSPNEQSLYCELSGQIDVGGRAVRYRFARQKSKYLALALSSLRSNSPPTTSGRILRDWLLNLPGIGPKTASWIARNWLDADDVAILDIHILRAGVLGGFLSRKLSVVRDYLELEQQFLDFSRAMGVRASELDAVIWLEMMSSPSTVRTLLSRGLESPARSRAHKRSAHPGQSRLLD